MSAPLVIGVLAVFYWLLLVVFKAWLGVDR